MKSNTIFAIGLAVIVGSPLAFAKEKTAPETHSKPAAKSADQSSKEYKLPDPVAVVNGKKISRQELQDALNSALKQNGKTAAEIPAAAKATIYNNILDSMITEKLVTAKSSKEKVSAAAVNAEIDKIEKQVGSEDALKKELAKGGLTLPKLKEQIRQSLQAKKWIDSQIGGKITVSEKDAKAFYAQHPEIFKQPAEVKASHILIKVDKDAKPDVVAKKKKEIEKIAAHIKKGEDFAKAASKYSEGPTKIKGGDLGYFPKEGSHMVPAFVDAAFKLKKGEVSKPVRTQFGFHLIKVTGKKPAHTVSFDEAKPKITAYLKQQDQQKATMQVISDLRKKADVKNYLPKPPAPEMPAMSQQPGAQN